MAPLALCLFLMGLAILFVFSGLLALSGSPGWALVLHLAVPLVAALLVVNGVLLVRNSRRLADAATYKVAVPKANGSGSTTDFFGVALTNPTVLEPGVAVTQTFLTIGASATEAEAQACLKFIKSKFARTMLGVLKITPDNPAKVWQYVPVQNFTRSSDIDWTKSIPEIDVQLYAKYGLDDDEIAFIEANAKPME